MTEFISPTQAQIAIITSSVLLIIGGGIWGFHQRGIRGLIFILPGLLIVPFWQLHLWLTRYNPQGQSLGLASLKVLLGEILLFSILGIAMSWIFSFVLRIPTGNSPRKANGG